MDPSLPKPMPGQGDCPPGMRPGNFLGQSPGSRACIPLGPGVPAGGWGPAKEGEGPGYAPRASQLLHALEEADPTGVVGSGAGNTGQLWDYTGAYGDWIRKMAGR